jgi:hypothetical protein
VTAGAGPEARLDIGADGAEVGRTAAPTWLDGGILGDPHPKQARVETTSTKRALRPGREVIGSGR